MVSAGVGGCWVQESLTNIAGGAFNDCEGGDSGPGTRVAETGWERLNLEPPPVVGTKAPIELIHDLLWVLQKPAQYVTFCWVEEVWFIL